MRKFIVLFFSVLFFSAAAEACLPIPSSEKSRNSIKESAYFIGQVKLLSYKRQGSSDIEAIYEVITPYKTSKNYSAKTIKIKRNALSSCDRYFGEIGSIYEEIFFDHGSPELTQPKKNKKEGQTAIPLPRKFGIDIAEKSDIFSNEEFWESLRSNAQYGPNITALKTLCEKDKGIWEVALDDDMHRKIFCRYKTNDFGKECTDSSQCESGCFAKRESLPIDDQMKLNKKFVIESMNQNKEMPAEYGTVKDFSIKTFGNCSAWKKEKTCGYLVEKGFVKESRKCIGE